jgi:hypothetical protein
MIRCRSEHGLHDAPYDEKAGSATTVDRLNAADSGYREFKR